MTSSRKHVLSLSTLLASIIFIGTAFNSPAHASYIGGKMTPGKILLIPQDSIKCKAMLPQCAPQLFYTCKKVVISNKRYLKCDTSKPVHRVIVPLSAKAHISGWFGDALGSIRDVLNLPKGTGIGRLPLSACRKLLKSGKVPKSTIKKFC